MGVLRKAVRAAGVSLSVSLLALSAAAQDSPAPVLAEMPAAAVPAADPVLPELTPAPVTFTAAEVAPPADPLAIAVPAPAEAAFTLSDWQSIALTALLADDGAMDEMKVAPKDREALTRFYASHGPIWSKNGTWTAGAADVASVLTRAEEDGLDPADYPLPDMGGASTRPSTNWNGRDWASAELKLSLAAIRYARDARGARINPSRLSALIAPSLAIPEADQVLAALSSSRNPGIALNGFNPPHPEYAALKAKLAHLRENRVTRPMVKVPKGPTLRLGMNDPRVPLIRARFNLGPTDKSDTVYDKQVADAVAAFQKTKGLPTNGNLNAQTVAALDGPSAVRLEGDLVANMERWRWLPRDLGAKHIIVNVPEFQLRLVKDGGVIHQTRVIVGKPESSTPIFSKDMKYLVVNPSWTVPPSILRKEFLPGLAADPAYAANRGYKVIRRGNSISVQQPPGERNALGYVKFMFPNDFAVYLHDTPNRTLFKTDRRAYSHGCVRVENPFELAEEIVGAQGWPEAKLRGLIGKGERYINLRDPLPVHLSYFTVSVDRDGQVRSFDDIYGVNRKVRAALGLDS
jgi:murein L,D-transpeptidase YcbB/YkuD